MKLKTYIKYYFPSLLFSAEASEIVKNKQIPKKLPMQCFAFRFGTKNKTNVKWDTKIYMIGEVVPLNKISKSETVLRMNIENNSPSKKAIKTHLGNWQAFTKDTKVLPVKQFEFENRWIG